MVGEKPGFAGMCAALPGGGFALPGLRKPNDINVLFDSRRFTKTTNINRLFATRRPVQAKRRQASLHGITSVIRLNGRPDIHGRLP